jgi:hypothetical protein
MSNDWRRAWTTPAVPDAYAHPDSPSGGTGPGFASAAGPMLGAAAHPPELPLPGSPAARHAVWDHALPALDTAERVRAVADALARARGHLPAAVLAETGHALDAALAGILPGVLLALGVVAAGAVLGGAAGAALGAALGGVGALPGAVAGAGLGAEAGVVVLGWLGIGFLAVDAARALGEAAAAAGRGVRTAWDAVERGPALRDMTVDAAARDLAHGAAVLMRGVLEGIVAFLLARGPAGAAARVPELAARLRSSRLGPGFATWIERNWVRLVEDPRLRGAARPVGSSAGGAVEAGSPAATALESRASAGTAPPPARAGARAARPAAELVAEREALARAYYRRQGWAPEDVDSHLQGIDFTRPVEVVTLRKGQVLEQWQYPGAPQGDYYALPGADKHSLGILHTRRNRATGLTEQRELRRLLVTEDIQVLRSTAREFPWGAEVAPGGGTQLVTRAKDTIVNLKP